MTPLGYAGHHRQHRLGPVEGLDLGFFVYAEHDGLLRRVVVQADTHDYARHGVASLFAAFNIADGAVISDLHRRHVHFTPTRPPAIPGECPAMSCRAMSAPAPGKIVSVECLT